MREDHNGLEVLDRTECLRLLREAAIGRIALSHRALPTVVPVSFALDDDRILVRTGDGARLHAAQSDAVVAFEVDDFDVERGTGWSVLVTGRASLERDASVVARVPRWPANDVDDVISISIELVSGRRISVLSSIE